MKSDCDLNRVLDWVTRVLEEQKVQEVASWRMIEYWFQVELFRSLRSSGLPGYDPVGEYEIPYATDFAPRTPSKRGVKWADLVALDREHGHSLWFELKDLGRAKSRWRFNAKSVGADLASLAMIRWAKTKSQLRAPGPMVKDAGRTDEWKRAADLLDGVTNVSGVIIALVPEALASAEQAIRAITDSYRLSLRNSSGFPEPRFDSREYSGITIVAGAVEPTTEEDCR